MSPGVGTVMRLHEIRDVGAGGRKRLMGGAGGDVEEEGSAHYQLRSASGFVIDAGRHQKRDCET